jgi:hypothetical protein
MNRKKRTSKEEYEHSLQSVKNDRELILNKFFVEVDYGLPISSKFFAAGKVQTTCHEKA